ncbi:MAG: hydroxylamine reductase [Candidatus Firestonebacteria bacterium RIFOXYC2_FULL_39_67]|nr:MAG: hydroxylamine reductase [Candidatus Firestonebacteria bacterium RIFOXYD2_FULL_39_29]OGF52366.1 MAG: hydroxylamine reductase [Candidatus Firestonebacteria bacterium RifOxyC12_full_39_7]OGF53659.1 MAG: hydroxylamine reductase [Candidatus Firestonebacteria bacterium RIFOXYC2_FULL_39_67]
MILQEPWFVSVESKSFEIGGIVSPKRRQKMFCYQCEQASGGKGCSNSGVCGKVPEVSFLQDLIIYQLKGIGYLANEARKNKAKIDRSINRFTVDALFTTVTNVNFNPERLEKIIREGEIIRKLTLDIYSSSAKAAFKEQSLPKEAKYVPPETLGEMEEDGKENGILNDIENEDIRSVKQLLTYGLKGMAAYANHAYILGKEDEGVYAFFHKALSSLTNKDIKLEELVGLNMECGQANIKVMELLDAGHTERFGHPVPTVVSTGVKEGPAIIVSGHDLVDLEELLKLTEKAGVNVYTHGEMLPAHGYPGLKKYKSLAGHFGTAWQNQQKEFDNIPAAILFTTNCIQKPGTSYIDRVYTTGLVAFPEVKHVKHSDFKILINKAKELKGFKETAGKTLTTGFARNAVLSVADKVVAGVKSGAIKHFFLVGGCDGTKPGRNYYTEFAEKTPKDTIILTLACGKFRFNYMDLGDIGGIPRLLDLGQCNDAYSAVKIALALADAFKTDVNSLPLSLILSWYEQKAVVILLSLLSLGIKGIRLGPSLPAFISPNILAFLVKNFDIKPIKTVDEDLKDILKTA